MFPQVTVIESHACSHFIFKFCPIVPPCYTVTHYVRHAGDKMSWPLRQLAELRSDSAFQMRPWGFAATSLCVSRASLLSCCPSLRSICVLSSWRVGTMEELRVSSVHFHPRGNQEQPLVSKQGEDIYQPWNSLRVWKQEQTLAKNERCSSGLHLSAGWGVRLGSVRKVLRWMGSVRRLLRLRVAGKLLRWTV